MGWRSLLISRPAKLQRVHFSLEIVQAETVKVPFEDIALIVLNHREITLTHPVLSACADYGIALYSTGDSHHPNGVHLPFLSHSRSTRLLRQQLGLTKPRTKQLWAQIVQRKIENQAQCLTLLARPEEAKALRSMLSRVRSGDPDNIESQAALRYFAALWGSHFHRQQTCWQNAALNYGYALLRGAIARGLVAHGFHPSLGLWHSNEQNAFNLADDLIEPFRPLIDLHVAQQGLKPPDMALSPEDKAGLIALMNVDLQMPEGRMNTLSAIEYCIESLARSYMGTEALDLPYLIGLNPHPPSF